MNELTKVLLMGLLVFVAVVADFINGLSDEEADEIAKNDRIGADRGGVKWKI